MIARAARGPAPGPVPPLARPTSGPQRITVPLIREAWLLDEDDELHAIETVAALYDPDTERSGYVGRFLESVGVLQDFPASAVLFEERAAREIQTLRRRNRQFLETQRRQCDEAARSLP